MGGDFIKRVGEVEELLIEASSGPAGPAKVGSAKKAGAKKKPTAKAGKQGQPGTFEAILTGLASSGANTGIPALPQPVPIVASPPPPRGAGAQHLLAPTSGNQNTQKMLEEIILALGGLK